MKLYNYVLAMPLMDVSFGFLFSSKGSYELISRTACLAIAILSFITTVMINFVALFHDFKISILYSDSLIRNPGIFSLILLL